MSPRRKTSVFEDLLNIFVHLPWWIGLSCAAGFFLVGQHLAEGKPPEFVIVYKYGFSIFSVAALLGAIVAIYATQTKAFAGSTTKSGDYS